MTWQSLAFTALATASGIVASAGALVWAVAQGCLLPDHRAVRSARAACLAGVTLFGVAMYQLYWSLA